MRALTRLWLMPLCIVLCVSGPAVATEDAVEPEAPQTAPFQLSIRLENMTFPHPPRDAAGVVQLHAGGGLAVRCELTWLGTEPATIAWVKEAADNGVRVTVATPQGAQRVTSYNVTRPRPEQSRPDQFVALNPGESVEGYFAVGGWPEGPHFFRFAEPGRHELTASLEVLVARGDPTRADSWRSAGTVTSTSAPFDVVRGQQAAADLRRVRGRVIDAAGAPVPRADVHVHVERINYGSVQIVKEFTVYDRAVSDDEGHFEFPCFPAGEPRWMLTATHLEYPPLQRIVAPDPGADVEDVELKLGPARVVSGTVTDADGRPLQGVTVDRPTLPGVRLSGNTQTDADGRFEIHGVTADATSITVYTEGWNIADDSNRLSAGNGPGSLAVVMRRVAPQPRPTLQGRARFENGEPARDMHLDVWVLPPAGDHRHLEAATDGDGRFRVELSSEFAGHSGPMSGMAELARDDKSDAQERWMAEFLVPSASDEIEFEFRREHSVTVHLTSAVPLPAQLDVQVSLSARPSHGQSRIAATMRCGNDLSPMTVRRLTAGRYQVNVEFKGFSHHNVYQDVTIPFDDPANDHAVTIAIPEVHFGSLRVEVRNPDGRKPADGGTVWMDGEASHGWRPISNGAATFPLVPVGNVAVQSQERDGIVGLPISGRIEADRETTLGPLVLRPVEEAYGHVRGYVTLSDGRPALGAVAVLENFVSASAQGPGGRQQVSGTGEFRISAAPDTKYLIANLKNCDLWPPGSLAEAAQTSSEFFRPDVNHQEIDARTRLVVRPVKLTAGEEQLQTIALPEVPFRDVTVSPAGADAMHVALWCDLGTMWVCMESDVGPGESHTFQYVPDRPTILKASSWKAVDREHTRHGGAGIFAVPAGGNAIVACDLSQAISLRLKSEPAGSADAYAVRAADSKGPLQHATLSGIAELDRYLEHDGYVTFRLLPGKYVVTARSGADQYERSVDLGGDPVQELVFDLNSPVKVSQ